MISKEYQEYMSGSIKKFSYIKELLKKRKKKEKLDKKKIQERVKKF